MSHPWTESEDARPAQRRGLGELLGSDLTANLYLALLRRPTSTEADLVDALDARPDEIAAALRRLESGRLARRIDDERWGVFPPERALASYASRLEERARAVRSTMTGLTRLHETSLAAHSRAVDIPIGVKLLRTLDEIHQAMNQLFAGAQDHVVSMRRGSPRVLSMLDASIETHEEPVFNGEGRELGLRVTFDSSLLGHPNLHAAVSARHRLGDQIRFYNQVPFTATVSDDGVTVVDIDNPDGTIVGLLITHPGVSASIRRAIDTTWQMGVPWRGSTEAAALPTGALDEKDLDILTLLTAGAADTTIARQLGISQRTVERRVRRLLEQLNASSRFQAGVQACKRGWI
ncbi:helix-turn-helix transcriptional regulator [Luteipulveratus flavus]|uniref:Helix-turn-helix transcriptional regulator n=1 Tax=Luteipulveratus flavus TaxID=3031728 RepID=A0ABT6CBE6_9MICO|nr:helix-turn-helix transcriptional regulator [Luteipulveratus sp. YIM 133296]MDF8265647.1 helix-turn-helix transcriptional regulator [Luteipulveratus sp. YIM 133296]